MELRKYAANVLKKLRTQKNISQEELAEELTKYKLEREQKMNQFDPKYFKPITRQTVSKYELGRLGMNQDILFDLSKIFKVTVDDFFPINDINTEMPFSKIISDNDYSIEIKTSIPFEQLPKEEQQEMIDNAMEELLKVKKETRQKDNN